MNIYVVYRENEFGDFEIICWTTSKYSADLYVQQYDPAGFWSYYYKEVHDLQHSLT